MVPIQCSARDASFATVLVGEESVPFVVHLELLTYHSPFFRAALTGNFKEADSKTVTLECENAQIFEFFVHWLYHKAFPNKTNAPDELLRHWTRDDDKGQLKTENLIKLYVICEKYDMPDLKRMCMDELLDHIAVKDVVLPGSYHVNMAFEELPHDSRLCLFLVNAHCHYAEDCVWDDLEAAAYSWSFLTQVMQRYRLFALGDLDWTQKLKICDYHEHKGFADWDACARWGCAIDRQRGMSE